MTTTPRQPTRTVVALVVVAVALLVVGVLAHLRLDTPDAGACEAAASVRLADPGGAAVDAAPRGQCGDVGAIAYWAALGALGCLAAALILFVLSRAPERLPTARPPTRRE